MMEASTFSKPDDEELELADVWSDLHALKKLYGLLQKSNAKTTDSGSEDPLDEKAKVFLMKLLDEATRRTLERQAKMVSGTLLSPPPAKKTELSCHTTVKEIRSPDYSRKCHQPQNEPSTTTATSGQPKEQPTLPAGAELKIDGNPNPSSSERVDLKRLNSPNSTRSRRDEKAQMSPKHGSAHHHRPASINRSSKGTGTHAGEMPGLSSRAESKIDPNPKPPCERVDMKRFELRNSIRRTPEHGLTHHSRPIHRGLGGATNGHVIDQEGMRVPPDLRQREQPRRSPTKHRMVAAGYHSGETAHKRIRVEATDRPNRAPGQPNSTQVMGDGSSKSVRVSRAEQKDVTHQPRRIGSQKDGRPLKIGCVDQTALSRQMVNERVDRGKEIVRLPSGRKLATPAAKRPSYSRIPSHKNLLNKFNTTRSDSTRVRMTSTASSDSSLGQRTSVRRRRLRNRGGEIVLQRTPPSRPIGTRRKSPPKRVVPPLRKLSDHREGRLKKLKNKLAIIFHHHHYHYHHRGDMEGDSSTGDNGFHQEHRAPWKYLRRILRRKGEGEHGKLVIRKIEGERGAERATAQHQRGYLHALLEAVLRHVWSTRGRKTARLRSARSRDQAKKLHWWQRLRRRGGIRLTNSKKPRLRLEFSRTHRRN
ncbi:uncharacterized protein [Typha latifolia]|uniref:uncharacterized protein n=1 Tax=Typha latifolia TaxID=4733 RepID=UPI003C3096F9